MNYRTAFQLLCWEGAFAMAYESWIGVTYLSGLAGELGVPVHWVAWLTALPWIGSIGQVIGFWAFRRMESVKRYTVLVASVARALWILPLATALFWAWRARQTQSLFPTQPWLFLTAGVACFSALFASSSTAAWQSWIKALTPSRFQGRFFGVRQRYVMVTVMVANLLAAAFLSWKPQGLYAGYALICTLALLAGGASTYLLSRVPDVELQGAPPREFRVEFSEPFRNREFQGVLWFGALFNGAIQLGGPYFPYYFTKELGVPMSTIAAWIMLTNIAAFSAASFWGKRIDRFGDPRSVLKICAVVIAFSPFAYVFLNAQNILWVAPFEYFGNGLASAGYQIAFNTLLLRCTPKGKNTVYYSVYAAWAGVFGAIGAVLGGNLAQLLQPWGGFQSLFLITVAVRLVVIGAVFKLFFDRVAPAQFKTEAALQ